MKHLNIRWNPDLQEWFCLRCGQTSDHSILHDAQVEMEQFECEVPTTEPKQNNPPGRRGQIVHAFSALCACEISRPRDI